MSYYEPIAYTVPPQEEGMRLKTILHKRMNLSRKLVSRLKMTDKGLTVNGKRTYTDVVVQAGDTVEIRMEREISQDILPQNIPFKLLYEDDHLLIADKPAGMVVHPTHGHYVHTLANAVVYYWQQKGEQFRFRPVHRLDQETSGVLAVAKNPFAHQQIAQQMQDGQVDKQYLAIVHGVPPLTEGTVTGAIGRNPEQPHLRIVTPDGYAAITHYRLIEAYGNASLIGLTLETGRTHQIRVHMKHLGCPLIGDKMYGTEQPSAEQARLDAAIERHALHAWKLGFAHPLNGERIGFTAPLPEDMQKLIEYLKKQEGRAEK